MKRIYPIICFASAIFFTGCVSKYFADPIDPRIPEYTERGMNVAGAYINGAAWRGMCQYYYNCNEFSIRYDPASDRSILQFPYGDLQFDSDIPGKRAAVSFELAGSLPLLLQQPGIKLPLLIELDGQENAGRLIYPDGADWLKCSGGVGSLYIRYISQDINRIGLAGTFGFDISNECGTFSVYSGRFDFVFSY